MSSPCPRPDRGRALARLVVLASVLAAGSAVAAGPDRPPAEAGPLAVATSTLFPGGGVAPPPDPRVKRYQGNAHAISEGARLFEWYNCSGCHFHGAGGMGPALMDNQWRYGGRLDQIYASIVQGRPNGMPSWAGKIPDNEIWEIAAFVKSLSTPSAANGPGLTIPGPPAPPVTGTPPKPRSEAPGVQTTPQ